MSQVPYGRNRRADLRELQVVQELLVVAVQVRLNFYQLSDILTASLTVVVSRWSRLHLSS